MRKICGVILLVLFACAPRVAAEEVFFSAEYSQCMDQADSTTAMILCMVEETKKQDARLHSAYKKLIGQLPASEQEKLHDAQLLWIKFRNAYSDFLHEHEEGGMSRLVSNYWYMYSTAEQARQLEFLLDEDE